MKIGVFTDSHYSSQEITCGVRYNSKSLQKIKEAYAYFKDNKCELIICLGDLIDKEQNHQKETENLKRLAAIINESNVPTVCVMGNHDAFAFEVDEFYKTVGISKPETIKQNGKNLLFIDACYFKSGKHYMPGDSDWTDTFFPFTAELESELETLSGEVYIFMHQNIDPDIHESHRLSNSKRIREIIEKSGKVKTVYQGHYHAGEKSRNNGIDYITFPAMCQNEKAYYILEI